MAARAAIVGTTLQTRIGKTNGIVAPTAAAVHPPAPSAPPAGSHAAPGVCTRASRRAAAPCGAPQGKVESSAARATLGGQPEPNAKNIRYDVIARGAGYPQTFAFDTLEGFSNNIKAILDQPGPVFVALKVVPEMENAPIDRADETKECFYEAELHRLKGEFLLVLSIDNHTRAEDCFRRAIDLARGQQAKSWELRAAMSLSRLWQRQGKRAEARQVLAAVYDWFTEGFDTADLQKAKALLTALG